MSSLSLTYTVRSHPRSRRVRIAVHAGGKVIVTKPTRMALVEVESLVERRREWILTTQEKMRKVPLSILKTRNSKADFAAHEQEALERITARVEHFNTHYHLSYKAIELGRTRSRWGSCSRAQVLRFTYQVVFLAQDLLDYIVVHELCHLKAFNHSPLFWSLVAETIPDYRERRRQLHKVTG